MRLAAIAVFLVQAAPLFFGLQRSGARLGRELGEQLPCRCVRAGRLHAAPGPVQLDVPGNFVALGPFLELLDGEEGVCVGHDGVVLRIHLAELPGFGLVLAEVEPGLAEQVLVLSVADGPAGGVHVVGLAPGGPPPRIADGFRGDLPRGGVGHLAPAAVGDCLRVVVQHRRTGARGRREEDGAASHRSTLARPRPSDQTLPSWARLQA
jgi:hypothetical protein